MEIIFSRIMQQHKFYFITIAQTNLGDKVKRNEILDYNTDEPILYEFIKFIIQDYNFKLKLPLRIKIFKNFKKINLLKKLSFKRLSYRSNLLCDEKEMKKNKNDQFNSIEYV